MNFETWTHNNILEIMLYYSQENHNLLLEFIKWYEENYFTILSIREFYSVKVLKKLIIKMDEMISKKSSRLRTVSYDRNEYFIIKEDEDDEPEYEKEEIIYNFTYEELDELEEMLKNDIRDYSYHNDVITRYRDLTNYFYNISTNIFFFSIGFFIIKYLQF